MKKIIFYLAMRYIQLYVNNSENLKPEHLIDAGWKSSMMGFYERDVKIRDRILIKFENHYYRAYYGPEKTFIGLENTKAWLDLLMLVRDVHMKIRKPWEGVMI